MEPMDCAISPDKAQRQSAPSEKRMWIDTPEGRCAAIKVENARMELIDAIKVGDMLDADLVEVKRKYDDLGIQIADIDKDLQKCSTPDPYKLLAKQKLLTEQAIVYNDIAADALREKHDTYEDTLRIHFRDLWLRATCAQIGSLPGELRNMIYQAALGTSWSCSVSEEPSNEPGGFTFDANEDNWVSDCHVPVDDDCFDPSVAGATVAREMAESWYKRRFAIYPEHGRLEDFLLHDRWDLGFRPAHLITEIDLRISEESLSAKSKSYPVVLSAMSSLSLLKEGQKVQVTVLIEETENACLSCETYESAYSDCVYTEELAGRAKHMLRQFFQELRPICQSLEQLKKDGLLLTVALQENCKWRDEILYKYDQNQGLIFNVVKRHIIKERKELTKDAEDQCTLDDDENWMEW